MAILCNLKNYGVNSNLNMSMYKWTNHETNKVYNKALMVADGKLLDPNGVVIMLQTIKEKGYVQKNTERKYSLSLKFFEIGNSVVANMGLKQVAYPFMRELASLTGEGVNLAIRDVTR